ncbi:putative transcriptional regulatory protein, partial [Lachnellula subtilissima]
PIGDRLPARVAIPIVVQTPGQLSPTCSDPSPASLYPDPASSNHQSIPQPSFPSVSGLKETPTAKIPSPHDLAAILSPSAPPEEATGGASRSSTPKRTHAEAFSSRDQPYLHPASPTQIRVSIASTGEPSPGTRGAEDGNGMEMRGGQEEKKAPKMLLSNVRLILFLGVNTGVNSVCKACASSNRDCTYPQAGSMPTPKRSDASAGIKQEEGESKKRIRKIEDSGRRASHRTGEDVLDSDVLTKKVWDEVYDIFKLHFSTEMPFLHPPTFKNRMRQAWSPKEPSISAPDYHHGRVLLLGVLTLTARFQPDLVRRHSPNPHQPDPIAASEYYATALADAFGPTSRNLTNPSLEGIQALLMLGLYEWGQTKGLSAWVYVGIATRLAQSMGFPYVDDPRAPPRSPIPNGALTGLPVVSPREELTEKEVRRRTWWSCFIMDRMLSAGKCRPTMIDVEKLRVQLPCSSDQFLFVRTAETGFLSTKWLKEERPAGVTNDDNVLSWYIRLVEIFGRFSEWSYAGGRRTETLPPWDDSTEFFKLRHELESFNKALPSSLTFSDANLSAHIEKRNATAYTSMHTLYLLCQIMLHREYIPFIPLRSEKPSGPLDEPKFSSDEFEIPAGFFEESAEIMFKAAKDIISIVKTCQEEGALPESPQIGFAVWQAAFICLYGAYFPHMDTCGHVQSGPPGQMSDPRHGYYTETSSKMLKDMVPMLKMVQSYQSTLKAMRRYFAGAKKEYWEHTENHKPISWHGGNLPEYEKQEKRLKEFGRLSDAAEAADQPRSRAGTNDSAQPPSANGEPMQGVEVAPTSRSNGTGAWAAINNSPPPHEAGDRSKFSSGGPHPYGAPSGYMQSTGPQYQQSLNQSNIPSLASPSNGDSSAINSPPATAQAQQFNVVSQGYSPSVLQTQVGMAPPAHSGLAMSPTWPTKIKGYESIGISGMDNFGQVYNQTGGNSLEFETEAPGYIQAVNGTSEWDPYTQSQYAAYAA